jgi:hypothetical protein
MRRGKGNTSGTCGDVIPSAARFTQARPRPEVDEVVVFLASRSCRRNNRSCGIRRAWLASRQVHLLLSLPFVRFLTNKKLSRVPGSKGAGAPSLADLSAKSGRGVR